MVLVPVLDMYYGADREDSRRKGMISAFAMNNTVAAVAFWAAICIVVVVAGWGISEILRGHDEDTHLDR